MKRFTDTFAKFFLAVLIASVLAGCAAKTVNLSPDGKNAFYANEVVIRINELQAATIQANTDGAVTDADAVRIVRFTVAANKTLRDVPSGWYATVNTAYGELKKQLPAPVLDRLRLAFLAIDVLLKSVGGDAQVALDVYRNTDFLYTRSPRVAWAGGVL